MVLYMDIFIFQNMIINYFLLMVTAKVTSKDVRVRRCILGAVIGVVYGLIALWVSSAFLSNLAIKLLIGFIMVWSAFYSKQRSMYDFMKLWVTFIFVSCVLSGVIIGIHFSFGGKFIMSGMIINFTYKDIVGAILIVAIFLERVFYFVNQKRINKSFIYECSVLRDGKVVEFRALIDTANFLSEPITKKGVLIINKDLFNEITSENDVYYSVPYSCVDEMSKTLKAIEVDKVLVRNKDKYIPINRLLIGCGISKFEGEFQGIFPGSVLTQL